MDQIDGVFSYTAVLMGSPILLKLFEHNEDLAGRVFRLIKYYEDIFTVNRDQSQVMDINHAAGLYPVKVSREVYDLIKCAKNASMLQGSSFNLAIGPLVKRWKIGFKGDSVPPDNEIQNLLMLTKPQQVVLDDKNCTVFLTQLGMEIDLGGIAKGYIADRVRDYLVKEGISMGLINLGGNVSALNSTPIGDWQIGLKKPWSSAESLVGVIEVANMSVVTSGVYERYFEKDGKKYHHILDPKTGYPLNNDLDSVTIISKDSIDCDVWATLLYGMGLKKALETVRQKEELEAIFLTKDKKIIFSSKNNFKFTKNDEEYTEVEIGSV
ncbi:membrane-associated lipoprotein involved in thiamine biosynthesis [Tritrichomonas foetus]|uniref:FAD:protein FMN transferase n=1 Tax=Tritrichomonas foetus TaxID=1144522 RepID=A0A1J4J4M7_9EUKA|nr:membrane-associated lipoprotein involved in thiamine biosynthesis [Tritrichomonas foetus]|eukprot:OHS94298.1 membrane-associated lipoprotein involved in thiamine biosynthesis [Tritrichomonas foetus]